MYQSVGFEFYNLSSSSKKENTYTKKIPTHHGRQGSFSEVDHPHKTPFIPQKLKAMVTKLDILEMDKCTVMSTETYEWNLFQSFILLNWIAVLSML